MNGYKRNAIVMVITLLVCGQAAQASTITMNEDFSSMPTGWTAVSPSWSVGGGVLKHRGSNDKKPDLFLSPYTWHRGDTLTLSVDVKWNSGGFHEDGIVWAYQYHPDAQRAYQYSLAVISSWNHTARMYNFTDEQSIEYDVNYSVNKSWHNFRIEVDPTGLTRFYIDGNFKLDMLTHNDSGLFGLGGWKGEYGQSVDYDNLSITLVQASPTIPAPLAVVVGMVCTAGHLIKRRIQ